MFDGKPPTSLTAAISEEDDGQGELRAISWSELVAQFDAVRATLVADDRGETGGEASFAPDPARHIAALGDAKPNINLDGLADGKPAVAISRSATNGAARDDREDR